MGYSMNICEYSNICTTHTWQAIVDKTQYFLLLENNFFSKIIVLILNSFTRNSFGNTRRSISDLKIPCVVIHVLKSHML